MDEGITQAHLIGKQLWTPEVEYDEHSFAFVRPLCKLMLSAGMALGETASDVDAVLVAVEKGMIESKAAYGQKIETHGGRAHCDPDGKYPVCEYCRAYAKVRALSVESRQRWSEESKDVDRQYAVTAGTWRQYSGEGRIHERSCWMVTASVDSADRAVEILTPLNAKRDVIEWPHLLNRLEAEAQNRHRCQVCSPDLPDRVKKRS